MRNRLRFGSGTQSARFVLAVALAAALLLPLGTAARQDTMVLLARRSAGLQVQSAMLSRTGGSDLACSFIYGGYIQNENASVFVASVFRVTLEFGNALGPIEERVTITGRSLLPLQEYGYFGTLRKAPCSLHLVRSYADATGWKRLFGSTQPLMTASPTGGVDNSGNTERYWRVCATTYGLDVLVVSGGSHLAAGGLAMLGSLTVSETSCRLVRLTGSAVRSDSVLIFLHSSGYGSS